MGSFERKDPAMGARQEEEAETVIGQLYSKANVVERPFVSDKPVVGPLIVAVREIWNSVSTKWFVRAIRQQQNEFNLAATRFLEALQQQVRRQDEMVDRLSSRVYEGDRDNAVLAKGLVELGLKLEETRDRLDERDASIDERLTRLERASETARENQKHEG